MIITSRMPGDMSAPIFPPTTSAMTARAGRVWWTRNFDSAYYYEVISGTFYELTDMRHWGHICFDITLVTSAAMHASSL